MKENVKRFVEANAGKDRIVGRPLEVNKVEIPVVSSRNYVELAFIGDIHFGHPQCDLESLNETIAWVAKNKVSVLLMGDLIEAGLRDSVGDSVYHQKLNPQDQMEQVVEMLYPIRKNIIGLHRGNHENRVMKTTSIDISKLMAKELGVRYLGYSAWSLIKVGKQKYSIYSTHGHSGARFKHTKLKAVADLTGWIYADIVAMGHLHTIAAEPVMRQRLDKRTGQLLEEKSYIVLTGSFLKWSKSYAEDAGYPISRVGSPKAKLITTEHDIHFRV
jgi:predicted phosphodiesterase